MQVLHLRFALLRVAHSLEQKAKDVILDDVCMRETNASRIDDVKNRLGILVLRQLHAHEELIGVQIGRQLVHQRAPKIFRPRAQFLIEKVVAGHNRGFVFIPDVSAQITDPPLGMVHAALARIIRNLIALIHNQLECVAVKDGMHHLKAKLIAVDRMKHVFNSMPVSLSHHMRQRPIVLHVIVARAQQNRQRCQALLTVNHRIRLDARTVLLPFLKNDRPQEDTG